MSNKIANRDAYESMVGALQRFENGLSDANEHLKKQSEEMYDAMEGDDYSEELCADLNAFVARMTQFIQDVEDVKTTLYLRMEDIFR